MCKIVGKNVEKFLYCATYYGGYQLTGSFSVSIVFKKRMCLAIRKRLQLIRAGYFLLNQMLEALGAFLGMFRLPKCLHFFWLSQLVHLHKASQEVNVQSYYL